MIALSAALSLAVIWLSIKFHRLSRQADKLEERVMSLEYVAYNKPSFLSEETFLGK